MKPVDQKIFDNEYGDCFRACVASIFEFPIEDVPNFWKQTQDISEFWKLNNKWVKENCGLKTITIQVSSKDLHVVEGVLCIACAKSPRGNVDHAVVWRDKIIHDPHPSRLGLAEEPDTFTIFLPTDPYKYCKVNK